MLIPDVLKIPATVLAAVPMLIVLVVLVNVTPDTREILIPDVYIFMNLIFVPRGINSIMNGEVLLRQKKLVAIVAVQVGQQHIVMLSQIILLFSVVIRMLNLMITVTKRDGLVAKMPFGQNVNNMEGMLNGADQQVSAEGHRG